MLSVEVGELLLSTFKGRQEYIAYCPPQGSFTPYAVPETGIPVQSFCKKHSEGGSCGLYVLRSDSTVLLAVVDFDDHGKNSDALQDAQKFGLFMQQQGYPCYLERSQSGSGGHVWFFFSEPISAGEVRVFLRGALADLDMGVEVYPKQARLTPDAPMGNLIRYPLCNKSAFLALDTLEEQEPVAFLQAIQRISVDDLMRKGWWQGQDVRRSEASSYEVEGLPTRVKELLESNTLLMKRWLKDTTGMQGDGSNSSILFAIAVELVRCCVPTPEAEAAVRYWCHQEGYEKGLRTVEQTVCKAYQKVIPKTVVVETGIGDESSRINVKMHAALDSMTKAPPDYHTFGIKSLDTTFEGGSRAGELTVIAGRANEGKTTYAYHSMLALARQNRSCLFLSLEMSIEQLTKKHISRLTDIPEREWAEGDTPETLHHLLEQDMSQCAPILFSRGGGADQRDLSLNAVIHTIKQAADSGVSCVFIDYLGKIAGCDNNKDNGISKAMDALMKVTQGLNLDMRVLSQLAAVDKTHRGFKAPALSDLAGSIQIARDADNVIAISWPYKYDPVKYPEGIVCFYKLKCRNRSSVGEMILPVAFNPSRQTYADSDSFQ